MSDCPNPNCPNPTREGRCQTYALCQEAVYGKEWWMRDWPKYPPVPDRRWFGGNEPWEEWAMTVYGTLDPYAAGWRAWSRARLRYGML